MAARRPPCSTPRCAGRWRRRAQAAAWTACSAHAAARAASWTVRLRTWARWTRRRWRGSLARRARASAPRARRLRPRITPAWRSRSRRRGWAMRCSLAAMARWMHAAGWRRRARRWASSWAAFPRRSTTTSASSITRRAMPAPRALPPRPCATSRATWIRCPSTCASWSIWAAMPAGSRRRPRSRAARRAMRPTSCSRRKSPLMRRGSSRRSRRSGGGAAA